MASKVAIINLAASKLGENDQLIDPGDDSTLGRAASAVWDIERRAALRDHSWNFAMRRASQPALAGVVTFPWTYRFPLPADCVRLIEVLDGWTRDSYQIEGKAILADTAGPCNIRYLADVDEPALWDDLFVEAFASRIAATICIRITGDKQLQQSKWAEYRAALSEAKRVDARENPQVAYEPTSWETARLGYGGGGTDRIIVPYDAGSYSADVWA